MLVREIWKFIHPRVSYSLRATPIYSPKSIIKSKANIHWGGFAFIKKVSKGWEKVYNGADGFFYLPVFLPVINMHIRLS